MKTLLQNLVTPMALGIAVCALTLPACSTYKDVADVKQNMQLPTQATQLSDESRWLEQEPVVNWWQQLSDAQLTALVELALNQNSELAIAQASIREARALLGVQSWDWLPRVEAEAAGNREKTPAEFLSAGQAPISQTYSAGFDAYWELDLFGRIHQEVALAHAQLLSREALLHAAQVSVAAEVATSFIELRGAQYQYQVASNSVRIQVETLALTERFAEVGRASDLDVTRAQAQVQLSRAQLPQLNANIQAAVNRLAVLTKQSREAIAIQLQQPAPLPSLPAAMAVGNTTSLLKRRPDIQQAELALQGAVAAYNVNVADLYPRVTFSGGLGYSASEWDQLGREPSETFRFAPSIRWAAFDLGRVHARINAADARTEQRLAEFEQTVLRALEETNNALTRFSREEERRQHLTQAAAASTRAALYAKQTFAIGSSDFLNVLDAERQELNTSAELAQSETQLLLNAIAVYKALGGGWQQLPNNAQVSILF